MARPIFCAVDTLYPISRLLGHAGVVRPGRAGLLIDVGHASGLTILLEHFCRSVGQSDVPATESLALRQLVAQMPPECVSQVLSKRYSIPLTVLAVSGTHADSQCIQIEISRSQSPGLT